MESVFMPDMLVLMQEMRLLEELHQSTDMLRRRNEIVLPRNKTMTVHVLKKLLCTKIVDIPSLSGTLDLVVKLVFVIVSESEIHHKKVTSKTVLTKACKTQVYRTDSEKLSVLEQESKRLWYLVKKHIAASHSLLKNGKLDEKQKFNEKVLRLEILQVSTILEKDIAALFQLHIEGILSNIKEIVADFSGPRSTALRDMITETNPNETLTGLLKPLRSEYIVPVPEHFICETGDTVRLPQGFIRKTRQHETFHDGDHEKATLLMDGPEDDIDIEVRPDCGYYRVIRTPRKTSNSFLRIKLGKTIKRKICNNTLGFGWKRPFKGAVKTYGFFHLTDVALSV